MTHQSPLSADPAAVDPGRQVTQLVEALELVQRVAGTGRPVRSFLHEAASLGRAYDLAPPIVQRRFDAQANEAAAWTAAGVEALISAPHASPRAAALLCERIEEALEKLFALVDAGPGKSSLAA